MQREAWSAGPSVSWIRRFRLPGIREPEVIEYLKGQMPLWNGPVEFYSAFQSATDFEQLNPTEDAIKQGMERVNFLIQHRLAIPDKPPQLLLDRY